MKSITTKKNKFDWYFTFRIRKDGVVSIEHKKYNPYGKMKYECIQINGKDNIKALKHILIEGGQ